MIGSVVKEERLVAYESLLTRRECGLEEVRLRDEDESGSLRICDHDAGAAKDACFEDVAISSLFGGEENVRIVGVKLESFAQEWQAHRAGG